MSIIKIDGLTVEVKEPDEQGEEGVFNPTGSEAIQNIIQPTELGETLRELNKDTIEENTRMSGIDMRTRLHHAEIASVLALDALVSLGVLPIECLAFTRQKKRLAVSLDGKGRDDIVNIVSGKKEMDAKMGMGGMDKFKNFLGMGGGNPPISK